VIGATIYALPAIAEATVMDLFVTIIAHGDGLRRNLLSLLRHDAHLLEGAGIALVFERVGVEALGQLADLLYVLLGATIRCGKAVRCPSA
jgi:hypothetical protein